MGAIPRLIKELPVILTGSVASPMRDNARKRMRNKETLSPVPIL